MSINLFRSGPPFDILLVCRPMLRPSRQWSFLLKMHRRYRRQKEERGRELEEALKLAEALFETSSIVHDDEDGDADQSKAIEDIDWTAVPSCLDPACKEAELHKDGRALRKRQQLASMIQHIRKVLRPKQTCFEFGAGSGHLSLLLAWLFPECKFIMCERKEYSVAAAKNRIAEVCCPKIFVIPSNEHHGNNWSKVRTNPNQ